MRLEETVLGFPITARLARLDDGVSVLLTGGSRTHVGAVTVAHPEGGLETVRVPGHKDHLVSEPWAAALRDRTGQRAAVTCGIHYDNASREDIREILSAADRMLSLLLAGL